LLEVATRLRSEETAAAFFGRAAALFDEEGLNAEAGAAWTEVLRRRPADEAAYQRCHALLKRQEDTRPLERLIGFKLGHTATPNERAALYTERATLHRDDPKRRNETIADHRRVLAIDPKNLGSLRALATLATEASRPDVAAESLTRALDVTSDPDLAHQLRIDLVAAHIANDDSGAALAVLDDAMVARPDDGSLREVAIDVGLAEQKWDFVAAQLETLSRLAATPEDRSAWTVRLGRLHRDQRRDAAAGREAFRAAVRIDPLGEGARELATTMGDLPLPAEDAPLVAEASRAIRQSLLPNPLLPRRLESLAMLARSGGLIDLAETAAQLHALLGGPATRGRSRGLLRALPLSQIAPAIDDPAVRRAGDVWAALADSIARLHAWDPASQGVGRNTKLVPGSDPRLAWADAASAAFGTDGLTVHVAGNDDLGVAAFDGPATLVLGRGVAGGDAAVRFRVGRALALLAQKAAVFDRITVDQLALDWAAAFFLLTDVADPAVSLATLRAQAKSLGKVITRKERKAVDSLIAGLAPGATNIVAHRNQVMLTANRAGLLVSGDLGMTLRVVSQQANPSPADLSSDEALDVIRFAFGDRFAELREEIRQRDRVNTGEHGGS
jgi:tetratricopeptide (TPR) repeat protein